MTEPACVATLARRFEAAEARCATLDQEIAALAPADERRNTLWLKLEDALAERQGCLEALTATPATEPGAVRMKAAIARRLLQRHAEMPAEDVAPLLALAGSALDDLLAGSPSPTPGDLPPH
ncbi:MAG: hypothetical protein BGO51_23160 [Rhodospirillales bacterium 69-11]|nr:MAG: hypothetical protein BGO51_23160 [Rhodospirillales bacterium 69-11]